MFFLRWYCVYLYSMRSSSLVNLERLQTQWVDLRRNGRLIRSKNKMLLVLIYLDLWSWLDFFFTEQIFLYLKWFRLQLASLDGEIYRHSFVPLISFGCVLPIISSLILCQFLDWFCFWIFTTPSFFILILRCFLSIASGVFMRIKDNGLFCIIEIYVILKIFPFLMMKK